LWWIALERLIAAVDALDVEIDNAKAHFEMRDAESKQAAFARLHDWLRTLPSDRQVQSEVSALCAKYNVDDACIARDLCLSWDELKSFAAEPLVTIGAHTVSHCNLAREAKPEAAREMRLSRERIEAQLQKPTLHFAYPYGDKSAAASREFELAKETGFKTAVTTRPGMVFAENAAHLTALPRISLNGNYQNERFLSVLTSGAATAMWNGFRKVDAA
jgi:peptidoglycan/xylan/chitin deacetylase (PgdA/CDA1 family)